MAWCVWSLVDDDLLEHVTASVAPKARSWLAKPFESCKHEELTKILINVDAGPSRGGNTGAVAAVCRSETGEYLGASSDTIDVLNSPKTLEAIACCEALALACDLNLRSIQVSSDCLNAGIPGEEEILETIILCHERRGSNVDAHKSQPLQSGVYCCCGAPPVDS
ncbi:hypothetical protein BRADI_3g46064v3 [Brachypodium distachyon]|uniref:RNase H type-1 domain-containing protein n=1 Tax=Brachypodium distachyon TaxID=15368 RepID=A0A0Q3FL19_BRADI|nr:hypothetical protein BRADI_3g46064v3 [Brachypodium distachyon]